MVNRKFLLLSLLTLLIFLCSRVSLAQFAHGEVYVATLANQPIMPPTKDYLIGALHRAETNGAQCLIVQMDTPGGDGESMRDIAQAFLLSHIPVIVYVTPEGARAASAGAIIALSANIIAMTPGTNIGASHPVLEGGGNLPSDIRKKVTNDMAAFVRNLAEKRGKNPQLAEEFVLKSISLTANEAYDRKLVDIISPNLVDLLKQLNGRKTETYTGEKTMQTLNAKVVNVPLSPLQAALLFLFNPNVALILGVIAFYGIVTEISHPGAIFPGVAGSIALVLSLYALTALDANIAGVALLILAAVLFVLDVYAVTHGVLTVGGIICFVTGSLMLFNGSPEGVSPSLSVIITLALVSALFSIVVLGSALRLMKRPAGSGPETLIGKFTDARTDINPKGKIFLDGSYWSAVNVGEAPIHSGDQVKVVSREGLTIRVVKSQ